MLRHLLLSLSCGGFIACAAAAVEQPMRLKTPSGTLHGTLTLPAAPAKPPVVLIVAGSGPTDRNGNSRFLPGANNSLELLAATLAEGGIASLRYDKRGVGESAPALPVANEASLRFDDYVRDATLWIELLAADPRFPAVGLIGHSEGSLVGMLAARQARVAAFVSIAGAGENAAAALHRQLAKLPPALAARSDVILTELAAGRTVSDVPAALDIFYRASVQPYLISWFRYTPGSELALLEIPCLIVQGDTDIQVGLADAAALHAARPACAMKVVHGMNHVLKQVPADASLQHASYSDPRLLLAPELGPALLEFLRPTLAR